MKPFFIAGMLLAIILSARATRIEYGKNPVINTPVYEDLYIAGSEITINAPVYGDLVIAGGTIVINDSVTSDILVAGGTVTINGYVGDDVRCAGGRIKILKNVAGDVVVTGGTVDVGKNITLGNLIVSGGEITVDGNVNGIVKSATGKLVLNGMVKKSIDCRGGKITINGAVQGPAVLAATDQIIIGDMAGFAGGVRYWIPGRQVNFRQSIKNGQAVYDPSLRIQYDRWYYLGFASLFGLLWYIGMAFLMILCIQYLFSATLNRAANTVYAKTWISLGYGLLYWIGVPVAAAIAFITVIGVPVGLLLLTGYVILLLLATVITSVVAANWLNNRSATHWNYWRIVFVSLGIFVVLKILTLTPFFGWLIMIALACIAFGAILQNINWRKKPGLKEAKTSEIA
jgi:cytoskeletal protein CcmA (bactofilin family)